MAGDHGACRRQPARERRGACCGGGSLRAACPPASRRLKSCAHFTCENLFNKTLLARQLGDGQASPAGMALAGVMYNGGC